MKKRQNFCLLLVSFLCVKSLNYKNKKKYYFNFFLKKFALRTKISKHRLLNKYGHHVLYNAWNLYLIKGESWMGYAGVLKPSANA